jgi:hypothetical protein
VLADLLEDLNSTRLGESAGNARELALGQGRHASEDIVHRKWISSKHHTHMGTKHPK